MELGLFRTNIGVNGAKLLGEGLSKCVSLSSLNLNVGNNKIGDNGAKYLVEGLHKFNNLT